MRSTLAAGPAAVLSPEQSLRLIRDAIAMVASGTARRVVVAGLDSGESLLDTAGGLALEAGVRARPIWRADGRGADIAVERVSE